MKKKWYIGIGIVIILLLGITTLRPVPNLPEEKCKEAYGAIERIYEGSSFDIVFKLMNDDSHYYINRGIESGLVIEDLKEELLGKEIYIKYPPHWTFLDPMNKTKHIVKLSTRDEIIYSEF